MKPLFHVEEIEIKKIIITDRARTDFGKINELTEEITTIGLLYPILINESFQLLDGERRLKAFKELGKTKIPARIMQGVTPGDAKIIEFMANDSRKSFLWHEAMELKQTMHRYWTEKNTTWSQELTAKKLNCSTGGLSSDLALADTLVKFPQLKECETKGKAREAYKKIVAQAMAIQAVESLPYDEKENLKKMMNGQGVIAALKPEADIEPDDTYDDAEIVSDDASGKDLERSFTIEEPVNDGIDHAPPAPSLPPHTYEVCPWQDLITKIPDGVVGFAELDPPYAIDYNSVYQQANQEATEDDWTVEQLKENLTDLLPKLYDKLLDNSWVLLWSGHEHTALMNSMAKEVGFHIQKPGIWKKMGGSSNSPSTNLISNYESYLLLRKGQAKFNVASMPGCVEFATTPFSKRNHQWEKPMDLYRHFFKAMAKPGSIFYSPFAGSGVSMVVATIYDMIPIGSDIKQKYFYSFIAMLKEYHLEVEDDE